MTILTLGRLFDILAAIERQDYQTAANLVRNSPGMDWQRHTTDAAVAAVNAVPLPKTTTIQPPRRKKP